MEDLQSAVLLCLDPAADSTLRAKALAYCQSIRTSPDGWAFVLQTLSPSMRPETAFWCLQVVHEVVSDRSRYPDAISPALVSGLRSRLLDYVSLLVYQEQPQGATPKFLLNKFAQVLVSVIAADYPHAWPDAFRRTVLPLLAGPQPVSPASVTMFFRVLRAIDDDVTSIHASQLSNNHRVTSIRVKDAMRDDCIQDIISHVAVMLSQPNFVSQAFDIISRYVEWVDIGLIVQKSILEPMYAAITSNESSSARPAAAAALRSIVLKRMDVTTKVKLLVLLDIQTLLQAIRANNIPVEDDSSVDSELNLKSGQIEVAALVNSIAMICLEVFKDHARLSQKAPVSLSKDETDFVSQVLLTSLPLALKFLQDDSEEGTASRTLQCVTTFISVFGQASGNGQTGTSNLSESICSATLRIIEERAPFPADFDPEMESSGRNVSFSELRAILIGRIFCSLGRAFPQPCSELVKSMFARASETGNVASTELALSMLISLTTVLPSHDAVTELRRIVIVNPPRCMKFSGSTPGGALSETHIAQQHQLELVSKTYFDLVARTARMLSGANDGTLDVVLSVFFDSRGLGHPTSEAVRSDAAYSLMKLAKTVRGMMSSSHLEQLLTAAHPHIFPLCSDRGSKTFENQMCLFETIGYVLGSDHKRANISQCLSAILAQLLDGVQGGREEGLIQNICAVGYLSKGFSNDLAESLQKELPSNASPNGKAENGPKAKSALPAEVQEVWVRCMDAVLKAVSPFMNISQHRGSTEVRLKVLFFLHRMVDTVGKPIVPYFEKLVPQLLSCAQTTVELRELISLLSQSVIKFRSNFENVVTGVYGIIVERVHGETYSVNQHTLMVVSEADREASDVHRAFTYFVSAIVTSQLSRILMHPSHQHLQQVVMTSLLSNAIGECLDVRVAPSIMKMSLQTLGSLVEQWSNVDVSKAQGLPNGNHANTFTQFALEKISEATVLCGLRGTPFRHGDYTASACVSVLTEAVSTQRICIRTIGLPFLEALSRSAYSVVQRQQIEAYLAGVMDGSRLPVRLVPELTAILEHIRLSSQLVGSSQL